MNTKGRILQVEDQHEWQKEIRSLLLESQYSIEVAESLQNAKDLLKDHIFDLVLLDLRLTDWEEGNFDGWKLMDTIASIREVQGTQVIICSARGEARHVREGFKKFKIVDYFDKKRLDSEEFEKSVANAIERAYEERGESLSRKY